MPVRVLLVLFCLTAPLAVRASDLNDLVWTHSCADVNQWKPQPSWLSHPASAARVTIEGQAVCFAVDEPGRGMKWSSPLAPVSLAELPYLVVRYRCENLNTASDDYLLFLDDQTPHRQLAALRLCDARPDGQWHTVAVDVSALTNAASVAAMAVQVPAGPQGHARLWIEGIAFRADPPAEAALLERTAAASPQPDRSIALPSLHWKPHSTWLSNPAGDKRYQAEQPANHLLFRVAEPNRGMKWSADLPQPLSLEGHRYVSLRYRARELNRHDYMLAGLGRQRSGASTYLPVVSAVELIDDGRWHTLDVDVRRVARELPLITGLAFQVQASGARAWLEVSDLRLVRTRQASRLHDAVDWQPRAAWQGFCAVPLGAAATGRSGPWRAYLHLADWFAEPSPASAAAKRIAVTAEGIPFEFAGAAPDLAVTPLRSKAELALRVGRPASEVYLLLLSAMTGAEEPAYGGGQFRTIADVDRFRLRLEYADGTIDQALPMNVATRKFEVVSGLQVLVTPADPVRRLESVVLCDATCQAAFAVAGVTVRTDSAKLHPEASDVVPPWKLKPRPQAPAGDLLEAVVPAQGPPVIERLAHRPTGWQYVSAASPLLELCVDGKSIPLADFELQPATDQASATRWYRIRSVDGLCVGLNVATDGGASLRIVAQLKNERGGQRRVLLRAPTLGYRLTERADDAFYMVPKRGAAVDHVDCAYQERYCGTFPVQFLDTFSPTAGRGLTLRTEDTQCLRKHYLLRKEGPIFTIGVEYPEQTLAAGQQLVLPPAVLTATDGDWHRGCEAYRRWVDAWHRPATPRQPWFREVFNFRQRFLWGHDPLYDAQRGKLELERAIDEARREFGGVDFLHLFDWGYCGRYGRIYGRTGDYSPYDYLAGGRAALRQAIAGVQSQGVPVGLYIEGYLLEERGKLGQQFGRAWQTLGADGKLRYWPQSTEMFMCAGGAAWQEVQASTYAAKVHELGVDGMYLDEFGFAGANQDCWSKEHRHAVPSYAVATERDCTRVVRARIEGVKRNVALYSEESPVDVTTQDQDGSFTYAMATARRTATLVPLNLTRFALPDFKTIEILYCDKPTGSWATGVKWVFFNGEALWLEGPAAEWFEPETRAAIRRCYAILHAHRDAFTTLRPVPLVPTEQGGVYANAFPTPGKTVYTLYNARRVTVRGPVLRVPHRDGATWHDLWRQQPLSVQRAGSDDMVALELDPCDVGCVVCATAGSCVPLSAARDGR